MKPVKKNADDGFTPMNKGVDTPLKLIAVSKFLDDKARPDMREWWSPEMETQVMVHQEHGDEKVEGKSPLGRKWKGYRGADGILYKDFRVPWNANAEPTFTDAPIGWDIGAHALAIGGTGWNWVKKESIYVGYDFDSIMGHSDNHRSTLTKEELNLVKEKASNIDWVEVRKSTAGGGLHLYVKLPNTKTLNHNEHAALARSILAKMSQEAGYDFASDIDVCGSIFWIWHRKMEGTEGLQLIKEGRVMTEEEVPDNWKDHIEVIKGRRRRVLPSRIDAEGRVSEFEELINERNKIDLEDTHKELIKFLIESGYTADWDPDNSMLITHTQGLEDAFKNMQISGKKMRGFFKSSTSGSSDQNCFAFPMPNGSWVIRRFTQGTAEHPSWLQDGKGWTTSYLNQVPDLKTACRAFGGVEQEKGGYLFLNSKDAVSSASLMEIKLEVHEKLSLEKAVLKRHKDGRLIIEIDGTARKDENIDGMNGWINDATKTKSTWTKITDKSVDNTPKSQTNECDSIIRFLLTQQSSGIGYVYMPPDKKGWQALSKDDIRDALFNRGYDTNDSRRMFGESIDKSWTIVNKPFKGEYTGNREWNRNSAQLAYEPTQTDVLTHPTWDNVLTHQGESLDEAVKTDKWCVNAGIKNGKDYLIFWLSALIQFPYEPLPYLFFYGPQGCGKSTFHELCSGILFTKGVAEIKHCLSKKGGGFNGEMQGAVLCVTEEIDLRENKQAYNLIKEWVTAKELNIHIKGQTPFTIANTTHYVQCSNHFGFCPILPGDTRIIMMKVKKLEEEIAKAHLFAKLRDEASDFTATLLRTEIPKAESRLRIPCVQTADKAQTQLLNTSPLQIFIEEECELIDGQMITFKDFFMKFQETLEDDQKPRWTKPRIARELEPYILQGKATKANQKHLGNIWWKDKKFVDKPKLTVNDKHRLEYIEED